MQTKISQHEIVLRYLHSVKDWVKSFNVRGVETQWGFIGSQGDKRARELAKGQGYNPDGSLKKYFCYQGELLNGVEYKIEGDLESGQRVYRAEILRDRTIDIPVVRKIEFRGEQGQMFETCQRY